MNTLKQLVTRTMKEKGISRADFIKNAGYKNINKGLKRFDAFLDTPDRGGKNDDLIDVLQETLSLTRNEILQSIQQTRAIIEEKERDEFKPFIQITLGSRPSPIFAAVMIPGLTRIKVQESITDLSYEQEIEKITDLYRNHRDNHTGWASGNGFCYYRSYDESLRFDSKCRFIDEGACSPYSFRLKI